MEINLKAEPKVFGKLFVEVTGRGSGWKMIGAFSKSHFAV